ncbi:MAG: response regulator transcription factor [Chloroflexi bacterium]|nr:response regulator transcription factor [Chloroflexota bacterium]
MEKQSSYHSPIKVTVVDDQEVVRLLLTQLIDNTPEMRCVGCCSRAEDALRQIPLLKPDVVVMDIQMPGLSGIECARRLKDRMPDLMILMLTGHDNDDDLFGWLMAGASGYLVKQNGFVKVPGAISELVQGGAPLCQQVARRVVSSFHQMGQQAQALELLTQREHEIMRLLVTGLGNKEIAAALGINASTVHTHIGHIFEKLQVTNRTAAAVRFGRSVEHKAEG